MRALLLAAVVSALAAGGCGSEAHDEAAEPPTSSPVEMEEAPGAASRPNAPPIAGESLDGESVSLADFRGQPVLVNVWSSW